LTLSKFILFLIESFGIKEVFFQVKMLRKYSFNFLSFQIKKGEINVSFLIKFPRFVYINFYSSGAELKIISYKRKILSI